MRLSTKHWLSRQVALALGVVLLTALTSSSAYAGGISIEVPHVIGVKVETPPLAVEVPALPTVEVPGVLKVETSSTTSSSSTPPTVKVEASTPPVTTITGASAPPTTTSTLTTPAPKASAPSGGATSGSPTATTATTASAAAATGSGSSNQPGSAQSGEPTTGAATQAQQHAQSARARGAHDAAARARPGSSTAAGSRSTATALASDDAAASKSPSSTRTAAASDASRRSSSSDPLNSLGRNLPLPLPVPDWSKPIILLLLLLAIGFAVRSQLAARRARRLERQRGTLLRDLDVMQAALVPVIPERLGALSVSVAYRPADGPAAGGDFYDLIALERDRVAIVLGDVVGHGRDALTRAALTRYTLRAYLQAGLEPRAALALASSVLTEPGEKQFATVVVGVHDGASGRLTYASAGHPAPISIGFAAPEPLTVCNSAPLCCDLPTGRRQTTISLPSDGRVCFFSDGLLEARVGEDLLGRERLGELAREAGAPLSAGALLERVSAIALTARDDMVACVLAPAVLTPASAATVEELEVDEEALSSTRVPRFLDACGVGSADAAALLADATKLVAADGTALLRIELATSGRARATASVQPGLSVPDWATAAPVVPELDVATLALPAER